MTWRRALGVFATAGAMTFIGSVDARAQDQPPGGFVLRTESRLVLLDVSVRGHGGGPVSGLGKDDFRVFEDGQPQKITEFSSNDIPVTVGILIDESFSMRTKRTDVLTAAIGFIGRSNPLDEIFILNFNDTVRRGLPPNVLFSDNPEILRQALHSGVPEGKTALNDAIVAGLKQLDSGHREMKALVVISDGGDNASLHTRSELLAMVESSLATIYTVGVFDEEDQDRDPGLLKRLAKISGGDAYFPRDAAGVTPVCQRIAKDLRTRYTIGYVPPLPADKKMGALRHIRVKVTGPAGSKLTAVTRSIYLFTESRDAKSGSVE